MSTQTEVRTRTVDGVEYPAVGTYLLDTMHTNLGFTVRHMAVSKVRGSFRTFDGTLELAERPEDSKVSVTIDAGSVDSVTRTATTTCGRTTSSTWRTTPPGPS